MKSTNKTNSIICLYFILLIITEFPIGVVDQYNNSWSNGSILNKHFFFFFKMTFSEFFNDIA